MFETHIEGEIPLPTGIDHPDVRAWSYVHCRLFAPWLHVVREVTYRDEPDGERGVLQDMLFLAEVAHLMQLQIMPRVRILSVDLMSPGPLNGTGHWKLEPLAEIWEGLVPMRYEPLRAFVYVLEDGRRYVDAPLDIPESELIEKQRVFKLGKAAAAGKN